MNEQLFHLNQYPADTPDLDDTQRIQSAIDDAAKAGGGKVVVPAGEYHCSGLEIKPGVHLVVEKEHSLAQTARPPIGTRTFPSRNASAT